MFEDLEICDDDCPQCQRLTATLQCGECGGSGLSHHSCGEDCCCCMDPEPNVVCDECGGSGFHHWCQHCGWDLEARRWLNQIAGPPIGFAFYQDIDDRFAAHIVAVGGDLDGYICVQKKNQAWVLVRRTIGTSRQLRSPSFP